MPVAITDTVTSGPHISASTLVQRARTVACTAIPITDSVLATGSKVIKLQLNQSTPAKYPWNSTWGSVPSLTSLAQTSYVQSVFSKPFEPVKLLDRVESLVGHLLDRQRPGSDR